MKFDFVIGIINNPATYVIDENIEGISAIAAQQLRRVNNDRFPAEAGIFAGFDMGGRVVAYLADSHIPHGLAPFAVHHTARGPMSNRKAENSGDWRAW